MYVGFARALLASGSSSVSFSLFNININVRAAGSGEITIASGVVLIEVIAAPEACVRSKYIIQSCL